jgi:glycosyltransferase involved in cell wall biosynthesis
MKSGLKIGIVTAFLGNLRAGTWTYSWNLLKRLKEQTEITAIDREQRLLPGLEEIALKAYPGGGNMLAKLIWPNFTLPDKAAADRFDLVHCTTPYGTFRKTKYKKIITICDVTPLLFPETHGRMNVWHHRFVLPAILKQADHIITISESSKKDIMRCFKVPEEKITVTLLAADKSFQPAPTVIPTDDIANLPRPYILNVGTLEPRKNLEGLLRAFATARRKGVSHSLVITGARGWGRSPLAGLIQELALDDAVIFTGFVDDTDLPHLYAGADFFVYPSLYEGFGLPILEAMSCGTPVITSNVSSMPEVAGKAALLVDPRSQAELASAISRLAGDPDLRETMSHLGIKHAAQFSWCKTVHETLAVYESVLKG